MTDYQPMTLDLDDNDDSDYDDGEDRSDDWLSTDDFDSCWHLKHHPNRSNGEAYNPNWGDFCDVD